LQEDEIQRFTAEASASEQTVLDVREQSYQSAAEALSLLADERHRELQALLRDAHERLRVVDEHAEISRVSQALARRSLQRRSLMHWSSAAVEHRIMRCGGHMHCVLGV
jgi:hypothetical protein